MKICPICDSKIEGRWCRECHNFVKPVEIKSNVYLNESHDPLNDYNCEFHGTNTNAYEQETVQHSSLYDTANTMTKVAAEATTKPITRPATRTTTKSATKSTVNTVQKATSRPVQAGAYKNSKAAYENNGSKQSDSNRAAKIIKRIVIVYFIFVFLSVLFPLILIPVLQSSAVETFLENLSVNEGFSVNYSTPEPESVREPEKEIAYGDQAEIERLTAWWHENANDCESDAIYYIMSWGIEPIAIDTDETGTYYYYDTDSLESMNIGCDEGHFFCEGSFVMDYVNELLVESVYFVEQTSYSNSYIYLPGDGGMAEAVFSEFTHMYDKELDLSVVYEEDIVTGQLHYIIMHGEWQHQEYIDIVYAMANVLLPGVIESVDMFTSELAEAYLAGNEYICELEGEAQLEIQFSDFYAATIFLPTK